MILDPLLMITLDLNITGAALATLLAKVPSALIAFWALTRRSQTVHHETADKQENDADISGKLVAMFCSVKLICTNILSDNGYSFAKQCCIWVYAVFGTASLSATAFLPLFYIFYTV